MCVCMYSLHSRVFDASSAVPFAAAGIRLVALSTQGGGEVLWSLEPTLTEPAEVAWARLIPSHMSSHVTQSLLVSAVTGELYVWDLDMQTGAALGRSATPGQGKYTSASYSRKYTNLAEVTLHSLPPQAHGVLLVSFL